MTRALDWLARQVLDRGVGPVIAAALGVLSMAVGLVVGLSLVGATIVGLLVCVIVLAVIAVALLTQLRNLRQDHRLMQVALSNLRRHVHRTAPLPHTTRLWRDEIVVEPNGDARWRSVLTIRVESEPLHFIEFDEGGEDLTDPEQRNLAFDTRELRADGTEGALLFVERDWEGKNRVHAWIHLPTPVQPGAETTVVCKFFWPRQFPELARGGTEPLEWTMARATKRFEYQLVLSSDFNRRIPLRTNTNFPAYPKQDEVPGGAWMISGRKDDLSVGETVWVQLDAGESKQI